MDSFLWTKFRMPLIYSFAEKLTKVPKTLLISLPLTWETLCLVDSIREKFERIITVPLTSGNNSSLQSDVFSYLRDWGITYFNEATKENRIKA